jgi:predicted ATPase
LHFSGDFVSALPHFEQGISLWHTQPEDYRTRYMQDPAATTLPFIVLAHWFLGYPEQALRREQELFDLVHELARPLDLAFALTWTTLFRHCLRKEQVVLRRTEELIALCTERGFAQLLAIGQIFQGATLTAQGDEQEGITQMCQALDAHESTGARLHRVCFFTLLAEAYGKAGQAETGLSMLAKAVTLAEQTEERYYEAELHHLKGELLLQQSSENQTEAESCFQQAISIAQNQSAKSWELRAATSLARLWRSQGKREEARELLEPGYSWFTEGFDTADLIDAKALLDELGG